MVHQNANDDADIKYYILHCLFFRAATLQNSSFKKSYRLPVLLLHALLLCGGQYKVNETTLSYSISSTGLCHQGTQGKDSNSSDPGSTTITPYMASLLVISLAAFMELEEKRKARVLHRQQIRFIFAKEEAEFILASF